MSFRYHGNYCGPGWSDAQWQDSVAGTTPPLDEFDVTCQDHDRALYYGGDTRAINKEFVERNRGKGLFRRVAGELVSFLGPKDSPVDFNRTMPNSTKTNLRSQKSKTTPVLSIPKTRPPPKASAGTHLVPVSAPAVIGAKITSGRNSIIKQLKDGVHVSTRVCLGKLTSTVSSSLPIVSGMVTISPVSFGSDEVQNLARMYQHFRILRAQLHYSPQMSTATSGEVMFISDDDPNFKLSDTESASSFYQRSLSSYHATSTPIWCPTELNLCVDSGWKLCDNQNSTTLEEFTAGVLYCITDNISSAGGYVFINMEIEFEGLRFNPRAIISGSYQGLSQRQTGSFVNPVTGADALISYSGMTVGDIYYIMLSTTAATYGVGQSATTLLVITSGGATIAFTIRGSTLLYARAVSTSTANLFITYDAAVGSTVSDKLIYGVTAATTSTFPVVQITQLRNSAQPT
jgi:hypothetical protein